MTNINIVVTVELEYTTDSCEPCNARDHAQNFIDQQLALTQQRDIRMIGAALVSAEVTNVIKKREPTKATASLRYMCRAIEAKDTPGVLSW